MLKFIGRVAAAGVTIAVLTLGVLPGAVGQSASALPSVDLNQFAGSWFEIARFPTKREKGCIANVVDLIALAYKRDHLTLVDSCKAKNDYTDVRNANIKAEKNSGDAKLKVSYIWPFSDKVWILALGPDYDWVLMGNPNHKALRVLSRSRELSPDVLTMIKQKAASEGYAPDKLMMTLQMGRAPVESDTVTKAARPGE